MSLWGRTLVRGALSVVVLWAMTGVSWGMGIGLRLESGTVLPYEAMDSVGHGVGLHLTVDLEQFQASLGHGFVFQGSRTDSALNASQLMAQWHPLRGGAWAQGSGLSPYVSLGLGLIQPVSDPASSDEADEEERVRWVSEETDHVVGLLGLGLSYGVQGDLFISAEARAVNHTHLGLLLGAGASF